MAELLRARGREILVEARMVDYNLHAGAYLITFSAAEARSLIEALNNGLEQLNQEGAN